MKRREFVRQLSAGAVLAGAGALGHAAEEQGRTAPRFDPGAANRELAGHRIAKITTRGCRDRFPRNVGPNSRGRPVGRGGGFHIAIVTTDQGTTGFCMCGGPKKPEDIKPLIGRRVSDLFDVERGVAPDAPWWMDKTLHELAARILGVPVWRMIGAAGPSAVRLYSGAIYMEDVWPRDKPRGVDAVVAACRQDYGAGYRAFKLKIGRGKKWMERSAGLKRDIEVTRRVREAFPDCSVLVDANDSFTVAEASTYVREVADCNLYWIEEPFEENADDLRRLREAMAASGCKALIADGESRRDRARPPTKYGGYTQVFVDRLYELAAENLVDVFVMDLDIVGYSRWRKAMPELVKAGVKASPHAWMWTMRTHQTAQLAAGVGNIDIVEGIPGQAPGIDYSAYRMKDGRLVMPSTPGFGFELG